MAREITIHKDTANTMERIADRIEGRGKDISGLAAQTGARASMRMSRMIKQAAGEIRDVDVEGYRNVAHRTARDARDTVDDSVELVRIGIRQNPWASIALAAGTGFILATAIHFIRGRRP
jgi:ElaB/YqjD/DUF883 family membrane-anchored ribosome-binding protein